MYIKDFKVNGFKNLKNVSFQPDRRYNIILGDNAQGKTNLIEAIYIMTGCKSFRGTRYIDCIEVNSKKFNVDMTFTDSKRDQRLKYEAEKAGNNVKKDLNLNGVNIKPNVLFDTFKSIYFTPSDIEIIRSGPDKRRDFVDMAACQMNPSFMKYVIRHENLMNQINSLLKQIMKNERNEKELEPWILQESVAGSIISYMRNDYIAKLNKSAHDIYSRMTNGKENLTIEYISDAFDENELKRPYGKEMQSLYYTRIKSNIIHDVYRGYTNRGINRDNIIIKINDLSARKFGSQGQVKSAALALKLAQAEIYGRKIKEAPVILLDDVMGELDEKRQFLVYEMIQDKQVFITTPNFTSFLSGIEAKIFRMKEGMLYIYEK